MSKRSHNIRAGEMGRSILKYQMVSRVGYKIISYLGNKDKKSRVGGNKTKISKNKREFI